MRLPEIKHRYTLHLYKCMHIYNVCTYMANVYVITTDAYVLTNRDIATAKLG